MAKHRGPQLTLARGWGEERALSYGPRNSERGPLNRARPAIPFTRVRDEESARPKTALFSI